MDRDFFIKINEIIEANYWDENFGPEELAEKTGMSHSALHRKLKSATGKTISQYIREARLEKAKELIRSDDITISEIAFNVGFGSASYFNKCFHDYTGVSPGEFKKNYEAKGSGEQSALIRNNLPLKKWAFYIASLIIIVLVVLFLNGKFSFINDKRNIGKSVAIRPFTYLSNDTSNRYRPEALRMAILHSLSLIKGLTVKSSASISSESKESAKTIGKKIGVDYLVEGGYQLEGNQMELSLQLIYTNNESLKWSEVYKRNLNNIFEVQSEIAQTVAQKLNAEITPDERQRIEAIPKVNPVAYDFYQQGVNEYLQYQLNITNKDALNKAEFFYKKALVADSSLSLSYAGLATVYWEKNYNPSYFNEDFLDSVLYLADQALHFDNQSEEACLLKGKYFMEMNETNKALNYIDEAIKINPNYWQAYDALSQFYTWNNPDIVKAIEYGHKAISLNHGNELITQYSNLGFTYGCVGLFDLAKKYSENSFELSNDSVAYYVSSGTEEQYLGNYRLSQKYLNKALRLNPEDISLLRRLGANCIFLKQYDEALKYYIKWNNRMESLDRRDLGEMHRIALAFYRTGNQEEAEKYFKIEEQYCQESIEKKRDFAQNKRAYYDLAAVYAFEGENEKAYNYLDEFIKNNFFPLWWINLIKDDEMFDGIRNEPRFQDIIRQMEIKYEKERSHVIDWLKEQNL